MTKVPWLNKESLKRISLLLDSYNDSFGEPLVTFPTSMPSLIEKGIVVFNLEFPVIAHDASEDPRIIYANKSALQLWGRDWNKMIGIASKLTTPIEERHHRKKILNDVTKNNPIKNYKGIRMNSKGEKFAIQNARIWNLENKKEGTCGQAATFDCWHHVE